MSVETVLELCEVTLELTEKTEDGAVSVGLYWRWDRRDVDVILISVVGGSCSHRGVCDVNVGPINVVVGKSFVGRYCVC